jgi:uncharacterized protein (UPF0276 family)
MIRLAANWSAALEKLLRKVHPPVDYLKCPLDRDAAAQVEAARALGPVLLHGWGPPYRVGLERLPEPDTLARLARASLTPHLSVHLDVQPEDLEPGSNREAALRRVETSVRALQDLTGLEVLLENMPHYAWSERPRFVTDPDFIDEALERSGAGLLLDLAHARVAAHHRQEPIHDYLLALPLHRAVEVHVSGPRLEADGLRDRHLPMAHEDYALLERTLLAAPSVRFLTLEYGGIPDLGRTRDGREVRLSRNDPGALLEQLGRLDTIRKRASGLTRTAPTLPAGWHLDLRRRRREPGAAGYPAP